MDLEKKAPNKISKISKISEANTYKKMLKLLKTKLFKNDLMIYGEYQLGKEN